MRPIRPPRRARAGTASLEAVMLTGVMFPLAVVLFWLGYRVCVQVYRIAVTLVGWPYL